MVENEDVSTELIEEGLNYNVEEDNEIKAVSRELFTKKEIDVKTEVSYNEINQISKIRFLENKFEIKNVQPLLESFLSLRVSMNRKSRLEFIKAIKGEEDMAETRLGKLKRFFGAKE
jgi:hypothetical protein